MPIMVKKCGVVVMGVIFKLTALLLVLGLQVLGTTADALGVIGLLLLCGAWILREKYFNSLYLLWGEYGLIFLLSFLDFNNLILNSVLGYDLASYGKSKMLPLLLVAGLYHLRGEHLVVYIIILALSGFCGYLRCMLDKKEDSFKEIYDQERSIRYSLEETKARLMASSREAVSLAEIKERNRIARDIHDHIGHSLAGILLQLQAGIKSLGRDEDKAKELLNKSVVGLADSLDLLRDTVHNIKPRERIGLEYLNSVMANFQFCPVEFAHKGDVSTLWASHTEIISSILKEGLTNASRYSKATKVEVCLDIRESIVRFSIKDNGIGCNQIREGLGISGMKERVGNAGGTISFSSSDGFMIVCVLPRDKGRGVLLANTRGR